MAKTPGAFARTKMLPRSQQAATLALGNTIKPQEPEKEDNKPMNDEDSEQEWAEIPAAKKSKTTVAAAKPAKKASSTATTAKKNSKADTEEAAPSGRPKRTAAPARGAYVERSDSEELEEDDSESEPELKQKKRNVKRKRQN